MVKDLVCGMSIDENTAAAKTNYKGTMYFFCAHGCLRQFLTEPEKYLTRNLDKVSLPSNKKIRDFTSSSN